MIRKAIAGMTLVALVLISGSIPAQAQKLNKKAKKTFKTKYVGQQFRLRIDVRPIEQHVGTQYVDSEGPHFPNYKQPIMYEALERVVIDSVGNAGGNFFIVLAKEAGTSDRVVKVQVFEGLFGRRRFGEDAISRANRETLATVQLRLGAQASSMTPDDQVAAVEELLKHVFYIGAEPTEKELVSFVKKHRDYPVPVLVEITGLPRERVEVVLEEN